MVSFLESFGWATIISIAAGSSFLTTVAVYLLSRFTSTFDAYTEERAKLLAQSHNFEELVSQTRRLTMLTEQIGATISDQMWVRQKRWEYKRDLYEKALGSLGEVRNEFARLQNAFNAENEGKDWAKEEADKARVACEAAFLAFIRVYDVAPIGLSDEGRAILESVLRIEHSNFQCAQDVSPSVTEISSHIEQLQNEAKLDLGYKRKYEYESAPSK